MIPDKTLDEWEKRFATHSRDDDPILVGMIEELIAEVRRLRDIVTRGATYNEIMDAMKEIKK